MGGNQDPAPGVLFAGGALAVCCGANLALLGIGLPGVVALASGKVGAVVLTAAAVGAVAMVVAWRRRAARTRRRAS